MISKTKLYTQLDALELELEESLIPHLEQAAEGGNDLVFCVQSFNPFPELTSRTDEKTETLVSIGSHILALKNKLGEPSDGPIAERICWYCREWGNVENDQRKSAQGLARQFLQEIEIKNSKK
jgi:hypothetical protein